MRRISVLELMTARGVRTSWEIMPTKRVLSSFSSISLARAVAELLLHALALADVVDDAHHAQGLGVLLDDQRERQFDIEGNVLTAQGGELQPLRLAGCQHALEGLVQQRGMGRDHELG